MDIRPIKTEADYRWALKEIEAYFDKQPKVGSAAGNRFDVLATLIEAYENEHYPIAAPDPIELIKAHMAMTGKDQGDLAALFGSAPRASEILKRQRAITKHMAHQLATLWRLPAEVLTAPYKIKSGKKTGRQRGRQKATGRPEGRP